jgi:hypothetical protein
MITKDHAPIWVTILRDHGKLSVRLVRQRWTYGDSGGRTAAAVDVRRRRWTYVDGGRWSAGARQIRRSHTRSTLPDPPRLLTMRDEPSFQPRRARSNASLRAIDAAIRGVCLIEPRSRSMSQPSWPGSRRPGSRRPGSRRPGSGSDRSNHPGQQRSAGLASPADPSRSTAPSRHQSSARRDNHAAIRRRPRR